MGVFTNLRGPHCARDRRECVQGWSAGQIVESLRTARESLETFAASMESGMAGERSPWIWAWSASWLGTLRAEQRRRAWLRVRDAWAKDASDARREFGGRV
jgi:hypothetical protein